MALIKCVIILFFISALQIQAQTALTGSVIDKKTGQPLRAVNVMVLGTTRGSSTDKSGRFSISNLPVGQYALRASRIGYKQETIENIIVRSDAVTVIQFKLTESALEADPIVILAGKIAQRLDKAPVHISVINSLEIARRNPADIKQILQTVPGVHFVGDQINIRGSTGFTFGAGNKVLLLLDGVPVYAADTGAFNWDMLPPEDIEQIEVLKGAGSTLWGSSALGGVVNVITRDPDPDGILRCSWSGGYYDKPYYKDWQWTDSPRHYTREDISYSRRFSRFGVQLSAGRLNTTGYSQLGEALKINATAKLNYRFPGGASIIIYGAFSRVHRGYFVQWKGPNDPYEVDESNLANRATVHQLNMYAKLNVPFSAKFALQFRASLVRSLMGNQFGQGVQFDPAYGQGLEIQATWIPRPAHTITGGLQFQMDRGSTEFFGSHRGYLIGPYLQDEWEIRKNIRLTAGLRYDRYQLEGGLAEDLFSPRLGLNWELGTRSIFRASAGSGFRAATIIERFLELSVMNFNIVANPELRAERSWAFDMGFKHYFSSNWHVDVSVFDNEYFDLIEAHLNLIRGQIQFRNIDRARIRGMELSSGISRDYRFFSRPFMSSLEFGLTIMDHEDLQWNEPLTYRPNKLFNVNTALESGAFRFEADYRYASKIDKVKVYPINRRVPMHFVDIRFQARWNSVTFLCGINNLLQYNYAPMESNLQAMRTYTIGLKGSW
ncbi:TonB-dependent receptor [bacterium]|nr:TonB-dependent receptor [bacterium]